MIDRDFAVAQGRKMRDGQKTVLTLRLTIKCFPTSRCIHGVEKSIHGGGCCRCNRINLVSKRAARSSIVLVGRYAALL